jgi:hypothetical protein
MGLYGGLSRDARCSRYGRRALDRVRGVAEAVWAGRSGALAGAGGRHGWRRQTRRGRLRRLLSCRLLGDSAGRSFG